MRIALTSLRELPPGAEFSRRQGRTRVHVGLSGPDTLRVTAETDSVPQQRLFSERSYQRTAGAAHRQAEAVSEQRRTHPPPILLPAGIALCVAGALGMAWALWKLR